MKKSRSILMVGPFPEPTTGVSLANKVVQELLERQEEYEVSVINTSYTRFDEAVGAFTFHKLIFNLKFYTQAIRVLSSDIIYLTPGQTFFGVAKYWGFYMLGSLSRKRILTHVHGNHMGNAFRNLKGLKKRLYKAILSKTTTGIVLSQSLKQNLTAFIPENEIKVLPNFAQDFLYDPEPVKDYTGLRIIYLSNLMQGKGIFELLQSLQLLEQQGIPYRAKIAGAIDFSQKVEIDKLLSSLNHTEYIGVVGGIEKKALLGWGNTFVLPTYYKMEGQPISILEAMATGNTIVTTRHAGIPDVIHDSIHGFFVEKESVKDLLECFKKLQENKNLIQSIGQKNQQYFQENFTKEIFKNRLLSIFKDV